MLRIGLTGGIGSGKTYIIVDEIVKLRNTEDGKNREIFTNIRGIDASLMARRKRGRMFD